MNDDWRPLTPTHLTREPTMSIQIDPETGLKKFSTRAAKATDKIAGKGYSLLEDEARELPADEEI